MVPVPEVCHPRSRAAPRAGTLPLPAASLPSCHSALSSLSFRSVAFKTSVGTPILPDKHEICISICTPSAPSSARVPRGFQDMGCVSWLDMARAWQARTSVRVPVFCLGRSECRDWATGAWCGCRARPTCTAANQGLVQVLEKSEKTSQKILTLCGCQTSFAGRHDAGRSRDRMSIEAETPSDRLFSPLEAGSLTV